jgi:hypothetical protein
MSEPPQNPGYSPPPVLPRKRRRVFMWVFIAVQVIFLLWTIVGVATAPVDPECDFNADCQSEVDGGAAIGVGMILVLWTAVDLILGIVYIIVRAIRDRRPDPDRF